MVGNVGKRDSKITCRLGVLFNEIKREICKFYVCGTDKEEFLYLRQGKMSVMEYKQEFVRQIRYVRDIFQTEKASM